MRVEPLLFNDRLFFAGGLDRPGEPIRLELGPGIRLVPLSDGRLQMSDGRGAWVSALSLALHLGWCRFAVDER